MQNTKTDHQASDTVRLAHAQHQDTHAVPRNGSIAHMMGRCACGCAEGPAASAAVAAVCALAGAWRLPLPPLKPAPGRSAPGPAAAGVSALLRAAAASAAARAGARTAGLRALRGAFAGFDGSAGFSMAASEAGTLLLSGPARGRAG